MSDLEMRGGFWPVHESDPSPATQEQERQHVEGQIEEMRQLNERAAAADAKIASLVSPAAARELTARRIAGAPIGWHVERLKALEELLAAC